MNQFLLSQPLAITPLTPVHIGCREDFEPTNYVIDDDLLYYFDPLRLPLDEADAAALSKAVHQDGGRALMAIQRFFHDRRELCKGVARGGVAVAPGIAMQYKARIGQIAQKEDRVHNQLEIERTAHHPQNGQPYLPGSSLKGAIRTGWLDFLNKGAEKRSDNDNAQGIEKRLLGSQNGFETDPFRLVALSDAAGADVLSKVVFACNHKKESVVRPDGKVAEAKGVTSRREAILGGQFRALQAELRLYPMTGVEPSAATPSAAKRLNSFTEIAKNGNHFYLRRITELLQILKRRRFANEGWLVAFEQLIEGLRPTLAAGELMLLRVGRHSGAESVTLDGVREIRIMGGKGQAPSTSKTGAKTLWLAAENEGARSDMYPFGWILVERADAPAQPALEQWCDTQPKHSAAQIRSTLAMAQEKTREKIQARMVEKHAAAAAQLAQQAEAEKYTKLSPEERALTDFQQRFEDARKHEWNPGGEFHQKRQEFIGKCLEWPDPALRERAHSALMASATNSWGLPKKTEKKQALLASIAKLRAPHGG